ncbi:uncharacterized protein PGTG_19243 [Puccinia graminis f. sp. tritici CRL 75-36-700-3]|uniref:Uncharacterized protein n=1 Tax=Puccinia graminis f. sp. tritici (strain CRL 75-36-700-3 / race SCCL) TaxID=418459 RepID=E3LA81_PUCGT|nr:uncharacterized protein PGTG_19243 [Puccinia graminis f. sp. tritici CRL 75-36-700-3]EFP93440.2 hypothetical protein PGTG_19243 [Puccinia graminis f. sp. tritici CRL 75-36-700-3]
MAGIFNGWLFIQTHGAPQVTIFDLEDWDSTPEMKETVKQELRDNRWTDATESHCTKKSTIDLAHRRLKIDYSPREHAVCITNYNNEGGPSLHYLLRDGQAERFFRHTISPNEEHIIPFEEGHWLMTWIRN